MAQDSKTANAPPPPPPPPYSKDDPLKKGEMPQRKIRVPTYRPNARDFYRDLNFLHTKINAIRSTDPRVCEQMIERVNYKMNMLNSFLLADWRRFQDQFQRSKSDKVGDAITNVQKAYVKAVEEFNEIANNSLKEIRDSCEQLRSYNTNKDLTKKILEHQKDQFDAATTLAKLPQEFEDKMQTHYTPIEKITGPLPS